jgi:hypothetical protein
MNDCVYTIGEKTTCVDVGLINGGDGVNNGFDDRWIWSRMVRMRLRGADSFPTSRVGTEKWRVEDLDRSIDDTGEC